MSSLPGRRIDHAPEHHLLDQQILNHLVYPKDNAREQTRLMPGNSSSLSIQVLHHDHFSKPVHPCSNLANFWYKYKYRYTNTKTCVITSVQTQIQCTNTETCVSTSSHAQTQFLLQPSEGWVKAQLVVAYRWYLWWHLWWHLRWHLWWHVRWHLRWYLWQFWFNAYRATGNDNLVFVRKFFEPRGEFTNLEKKQKCCWTFVVFSFYSFQGRLQQ